MTDLEVDLDNLDVTDDLDDDQFARIRKSHLDNLRGAAKNASKHRREAEDLRAQFAFTEAGLTSLGDEQRAALTALVKDPTAETLKAKAAALGFIEAAPEPEPVSEQELQQIDEAAQVANGAGAPPTGQITPQQAANWPVDKRMRFAENHPDLMDTLMRGEQITAPAGFTT